MEGFESSVDPALLRRIEYVKQRVRLRDIMTRLGHRPRLVGNMICCWHDERNPSARLYDNQDTYWCWVCSPGHGVDQLEFVAIDQGFEADVDPGSKLPLSVRHSLATLKALEWLEAEFDVALEFEPWEERLGEALHRRRLAPASDKYWRRMHEALLRALIVSTDPNRFINYSEAIVALLPHQNTNTYDQRVLWEPVIASLNPSTIEPPSTQEYSQLPLTSEGVGYQT